MKLFVLSFLVGYAYAAYYEETKDYWINRINSGNYGFKAGHNPYLDGKSKEDIKRLMGTRLDQKSRTKPVVKKYAPKTMPTSFLTGVDAWPNCKSTVFFIKDQADCGSCWAVAASEVIADRICIGNYNQMTPDIGLNEGKPAISMSDAQIMDCCTWCGQGCQGGYPIDAMKFWAWTGVVTGGWYGSNCGCQPYQIPPCPPAGCSGPEAETPPCSNTCSNGADFNGDKHHAIDHYQLYNAHSIMQDIQAHGSVECGFRVYENFMHYTSGIYSQAEGDYLGGHAVKIIGWGTDAQSGTDYWVINNSWNVTWGLNGQFKFKRGTDLCSMESQCVAGLAKNPDSNFKLQC
jgi:cathepsin B